MPENEALISELKELIVSALGLEDVEPDSIDSDGALFGDGLNLDSIDALELGIALSKKYNVSVDPNDENVQRYFASVRNLAAFVDESKGTS